MSRSRSACSSGVVAGVDRVAVEQHQIAARPGTRRSPGRRRKRPAPRAGSAPARGARAPARRRCGGRRPPSPATGRAGRPGASEPNREGDAVVEHPAEREAPVRPVGPDPLGRVAVVEQVGRLDARPDAERGQPAYVLAPDQLGVLDRAPRSGRGVGHERGSRPPRRRSRGWRPPGRCATADRAGRAAPRRSGSARREPDAVGVRLAAPGGPGVERPVGDDLERPHRDPLVAVRQHVAGPQARRDDGVEPVGVRRRPDPQQVGALVRTARPSRGASPLNSKSTMPVTPMAAAASMVRS